MCFFLMNKNKYMHAKVYLRWSYTYLIKSYEMLPVSVCRAEHYLELSLGVI